MTVALDLTVEDPAWEAIEDLHGLAERALAAALAEAPGRIGGAAELSCLFCGDAGIQDLNARWRGQDKPTNVLSFPAPSRAAGEVRLLGDIVLAFGTVAREAEAEGKALEAHASHLVIHGVLHLLGFDHEDAAEAERMEALETRAVGRLGYPDPYADGPAREEP